MSDRSEEAYLVLKAQAGNKRAFGVLYRAYYVSLVRFAYKLCHNEQLASDAVQDAWITIVRTLVDLHDPAMFRARVFKAVRWRTIDLMRKREVNFLPVDEEVLNGVAQENNIWATKSQILALVNKLPDMEQQAVYLFYLEGMKLNEISAVLDVPAGTLKSRLSRARSRLKDMIEGEENGFN